jgi:hypothetical protein
MPLAFALNVRGDLLPPIERVDEGCRPREHACLHVPTYLLGHFEPQAGQCFTRFRFERA